MTDYLSTPTEVKIEATRVPNVGWVLSNERIGFSHFLPDPQGLLKLDSNPVESKSLQDMAYAYLNIERPRLLAAKADKKGAVRQLTPEEMAKFSKTQ